ncbi:MAG: TolC family protein [Elusimicrobiales bacterium]|nr:TolC family protein [Elusimicrobiales bacterium]
MKRSTTLLLAALLHSAPAFAAGGLDIQRCFDLALKNNLYVKLAASSGEAQKAEALSAAARLLPQVEFSVSQERTLRENLTAMGFGSLPGGGANLIGPFNTFDARLRLVASVLDLSARGLARSKSEEEKISFLRLELVKEQVTAAAALAYLDVLRASAAENSASSGRDLARSLRELAENKHEAGSATGLDVVRAKTREAEESLRVIRARTSLEEARLRLKHMLGVPLAQKVDLTEELSFAPDQPLDPGEAVKTAQSARLEIAIARTWLSAGEYSLAAAKGSRLPTVSVTGSAAMSGANPDHDLKLVGDMGVKARLPLFSGGRLDAGIDGASAAKSQAESRLRDTFVQVEEEVRIALYRLKASAEEVETASMTVTLGEQELEMARNRFAAGVGDNVELVNAQTSLSRARDSRVDALSRHKEANIRLTLALGSMKSLKF